MVSSLRCDEPAVNTGDVLRVEAGLMVLCQTTHAVTGVVLSRDIMLSSQLIEVNLHVVLEKPGFFEPTATDLAAVLERILVFPHVALQEPGLAEGLATHLTGELSHWFSLVSNPRGWLVP